MAAIPKISPPSHPSRFSKYGMVLWDKQPYFGCLSLFHKLFELNNSLLNKHYLNISNTYHWYVIGSMQLDPLSKEQEALRASLTEGLM